jgi:pimeloyl-ACP methyl ester carboxylesterase
MGAGLLVRRPRPTRLAQTRLTAGEYRRGSAGPPDTVPRLLQPPEIPGVANRYIEARGLRFHYAEAGPRDADPILLLHGWPQHHYEWRHILTSNLGDSNRLIALDLRGYGWTDAPRFGYDKENFATDTLAVLDALDLDRVKLIGHDWGGWAGFLMCIREPERFSHFLALGITHPWQTVGSGSRHLHRFAYQIPTATPFLGYALHRSHGYIRLILQGGTHGRDTFTRPELDSFADNLAEPARARACVQTYRAFVAREAQPLIRGRYANTRMPTRTHLMLGDSDPVIKPSMLAGYEQHADAMTTEIVPNCGHFIADEYPDLVTQRARELFG